MIIKTLIDRRIINYEFDPVTCQLFPVFRQQEMTKKKVLVPSKSKPVPDLALRAILQESEAKLEMKIFNPPFNFCVEVGYLEG